MSHGRWAEAAEELEQSISIYKELAREFPDATLHNISGRSVGSVRPYDISAQALTSELARTLLNSGQQSKAEHLSMELDPRTGSDFVARGNIYKELQQDDKAIADYVKALELGLSGQIPLVRRVGGFLDEIGQHDKAILFFNYHVEVYPDGTVCRTYASRGASWAHLKQYDNALVDFNSYMHDEQFQGRSGAIDFGPFTMEAIGTGGVALTDAPLNSFPFDGTTYCQQPSW